MSDFFDTPEKVATFLGGIANYIDPNDQLMILEALATEAEDCPIFDSFCLNDEQFNAWNKLRQDILEGYGLSTGDAASQVEELNKIAGEELENLAEILSKGLNEAIADALSALYDDGTNRGTGLPGPLGDLDSGPESWNDPAGDGEDCKPPKEKLSALPQGSEATDAMMSDLVGFLVGQIEGSYNYDTSMGRKSPFSLILSDTSGKPFSVHNRKRKGFSRKWWFDTPEQRDQAVEDEQATDDSFPWKHKGYYPTTVGASL